MATLHFSFLLLLLLSPAPLSPLSPLSPPHFLVRALQARDYAANSPQPGDTRRHPERPRGAPGRTGLSSLLPPPDQPPLSRPRDGDVRREADQRVPEHLPGHPEGQEVPLRHLQDRRRGDLPGQGEKDHHMRIKRHTISPRDFFLSLCLAPYG